MYSDHSKITEIRYQTAELSKTDGIEFTCQRLWTPIIDSENIAYYSLFKTFSKNQFLYPRLPIDMGLYLFDDKINVPNILRMPLKFPGTNYRIPKELNDILTFIQKVAEYETFLCVKHNIDPDTSFCHITYDKTNVSSGQYHRYPGFHGDGIQGTKLTPKVVVEHSYIWTSSPPTEFCLQPFFLNHLDEAKHNYFLEFDRQARQDNVYCSLPNHLYLIDPYMVHRTPKITENVTRTFIRITFAFTELQHPNNTINPLFVGDYAQKYHKRTDIRSNLMPNEFEVPYHLYSLSKKD